MDRSSSTSSDETLPPTELLELDLDQCGQILSDVSSSKEPETSPEIDSPSLPKYRCQDLQTPQFTTQSALSPEKFVTTSLKLHERTKKSEKFTIGELAAFLGVSISILSKQISRIKRAKAGKRGEALQSYMKNIWNQQTVTPVAEEDYILNIVQTSENQTLRDEIRKLNNDLNGKEEELTSLTLKHGYYIDKHKNVCKLLKSTKSQLVKKRNNYSKLFFQKRNMERRKTFEMMRTFKARILRLEDDKTKANKTILSLRKQSCSTESVIKEFRELISQKESLLTTSESSRSQQIGQLKQSIDYLESLLKDQADTNVKTQTEDNIYTTDFQLCVMNLLSEGVGIHHINKVLQHVAKFCGKTIKKCPAVTTIRRISDQRASVSLMHIGTELKHQEETTLMSDETRKLGESYEIFGVRDKDEKNWVLGLRNMYCKSSESCLNTLKTIISDINDTSTSTSGNKILTNIKNTMSDRAATEKKFHDLLKEYREDILPSIYSNWESLTESEQDSYSSMNNFYCGLHLLVNMAETAQKMLLTVEKEELENPGISASAETSKFVSTGESGTVRMIRTTTKCLARGGDEKSGCYKDFKSFILGKEKEDEYTGPSKHRLLVPFRGNRFNILFYDAEAVFYLSKHIIEFFSDVITPANLLHKAVFFDVKETFYIAACKSLGLCSKFITSPLWRIIESNVSVQEISDTYQTLHSFFLNTQKDVSGFMCGDDIPFPDQVNKDELYERLIMPDDNDAKTAVILHHLFTVWSTLIKKSVADHLESGKYKNISPSMAKETKSVPLHNKFPERVFAFLDALIRFRPSASTLCNEAHIMFCLNKTGKWLDELPLEEREKVINKARSEGREMRNKFKGRMEEIENKCSENLREKRIQIEKKKSKEFELKEELTNSILFHGLWQFPETVDSNLQDMKSEAEKRKALRAQLQFRKVVLGQTVSDKKIFQLSEKGVLYSTSKLTENLKVLIDDALKKSTPRENIFVSKEIVHYQDVNGVRTAFDGRVISSVPGYNEWYNVVYKGDNAVYVYKLAEDYEAGDLIIKP